MFTVTEAHDDFPGGQYATLDKAVPAGELAAWLELVTTDGGTILEVSGELAAYEMASVRRLARQYGAELTMSAPITVTRQGERVDGYAVRFVTRARVA